MVDERGDPGTHSQFFDESDCNEATAASSCNSDYLLINSNSCIEELGLSFY